jgi:hypothetical protein
MALRNWVMQLSSQQPVSAVPLRDAYLDIEIEETFLEEESDHETN